MSTKRRSLLDVLPAASADQAAPVPAEVPAPVEVAVAPEPAPVAAPRPRTKRAKPIDITPVLVTSPPSRAKYARLEAKEARLRTDQREDLGALARRLERARPTGAGERITENTLIRVAIDVLLTMGDQLEGVDEDQVLAAARRGVK